MSEEVTEREAPKIAPRVGPKVKPQGRRKAVSDRGEFVETEHGYVLSKLSREEKKKFGPRVPTARVVKVVNEAEPYSLVEYVTFEEVVDEETGQRKQVEVREVVETPAIFQIRIPYSERKFDYARFALELQAYGGADSRLVPSEQMFPELGRFCGRLECWETCSGESVFCSESCRVEVEAARFRLIDLSG